LTINIHTHHPIGHGLELATTMPLEQHNYNHYSCGLHPWYLQHAQEQLSALEVMATHNHCLAIGECGLDKVCNTDYALQLQYFQAQILLANAVQKPLIIHCVKSSNDIVQQLMLHQNNVPVIIHGFVSNANIANLFLKKNYYLSFGAAVLSAKGNAQQVVQQTPIEQLFLETDNDAHINIQDVYTQVALLKNISVPLLEKQIQENFNRIFASNTI
jgi:TatD DNase family protein